MGEEKGSCIAARTNNNYGTVIEVHIRQQMYDVITIGDGDSKICSIMTKLFITHVKRAYIYHVTVP